MPRALLHEAVLAALVLAEIAVFGVIGHNFLTVQNLMETLRLSTELGLLAVALTPILVTGGIDLSVGSMMGLGAVVFGLLVKDARLPEVPAAALTVVAGGLGGGLNATLITRLGLPPLIVTLGTYSLFRGLAEGVTAGVRNFTDFDRSFLLLGQGYLGGWIPAQAPLLAAVALGYAWLLHRTTIGRGLFAIGFAPEGARHAGVPVETRLALVYGLSGLVAGLAAVVYVAHLGQAKADAGTSYELMAITAVVLGGTSIFGGRGTIGGTILGLVAVAVLQNGLRLADLPSELAGILVGALLLSALLVNRALLKKGGRPMTRALLPVTAGLLCVALACTSQGPGGEAPPASSGGDKLVIAMMPKNKGNPYFIGARQGADEAAKELGVTLLWDGPTETDPAKQNEVVETWITRGVHAIAASVENREGLATVLRKARGKGIKVVTWDADTAPDARDFFVNQATPQGIGYTLVDNAARLLDGQGEFAIITASLTAANQNSWLEHIRARLAEKYPGMKLVTVRPSDDKQDVAFTEAQNILKVHPNVRLIMGICSPAVPAAAEAVKQAGRAGQVKVMGLALPDACRKYIHEGVIDHIVLWNVQDLGYLTVHTAAAAARGRLAAGGPGLAAGRLGTVEVQGTEVLLGRPFVFDKTNVDNFHF